MLQCHKVSTTSAAKKLNPELKMGGRPAKKLYDMKHNMTAS
jgi:hypothetical protein